MKKFKEKSKLVTHVFIHKRGVCALPRCDAAAAVPQRDQTRLDPGGAEAVEEVGLAGDFVLVKVCVAEFADVYLCNIVSCVYFNHRFCSQTMDKKSDGEV